MEQGIALIPNEVVSLIDRLEAAERVVLAHSELEADNISYDDFVSLLVEWRKSKGDGV